MDADPKTTEDRISHARAVIGVALAASREVPKQIADESDAERIVGILGKIVAARKLADEQRKALTKPHRAQVAAINDRFRELAGPLDGAERGLKAAVAGFRREEQRRRDAERAREERNRRERQARENEKAAKEKREPVRHEAPRIPEPASTVEGGAAAATVRKIKKWRIADVDAIPRQYLVPDNTKIGKVVKAGVEIPGIEVYEDDEVAVST